TTDILIRIFNANSHGPVFVGVIGETELGSTGIGHSHSKVLILVVSNCEIRGHWSSARAVRSQPTPCLPRKKFPFASFYIYEIKPEPIGMRFHALIHTGSIITAEVAFHIAGDIAAVKVVCDLDV